MSLFIRELNAGDWVYWFFNPKTKERLTRPLHIRIDSDNTTWEFHLPQEVAYTSRDIDIEVWRTR